MNRWQQIDEVLQSVLERAPEHRRAFLEGECAGDEDLRREVESLLAAHDAAGSFMEKPVIEIDAGVIAKGGAASLAGCAVNQYRIVKSLGAGGMGEVYLAEDTRLRRKVALKLLPAHFARDEDRLRRFEQEACAASALNHPNIITIHEIGADGDSYYIATELIEGETLRDVMSGERMQLADALDVAAQIASALTAAHEAGIVHRDIKPENVMLRADGYVKVLDFGLAKLLQRRGEGETRRKGDDEPTLALSPHLPISPSPLLTEPGMVMGTISYMSPEQARGAQTDARTDIWSLGVVLYEMAASRRPFDGDTPSHTIVSILEKEPPALSNYNADAPPELEWIVTKALAKEKEKRCQTAKDLLNDLRELKKRLEIEAEIARRAAPDESATRIKTGERRRTIEPTFARESPATDARAAQATSSAEYIVSEIKRHKVGAGLAASLALCIALLIYFGGIGAGKNINSLAVLPFVNASADPEAEYFSDGVTESLTNSLSQLPDLKVMSRNSVFRYKGKDMDALAAGKDLGVRAVLTGRVAQRGDGLTVSVELVDARDNSQIWGRQYNRKFADVLAMQEEIARDISEKLRSKLTGEEQRRVTRQYTDNVEAYQLYLRGRHEWHKFSPEGVVKSIEFFNRAIAVDPTYAPAFAWLSAAYNLQGHLTRPTAEVYPQAKWAAERAVALDDSLAEAHLSLAGVKLFFDWDWVAAEREIRRAIELNPNDADAHQQLGVYLTVMGRMDEAEAETRRAQELDPLSLFINAELAQVLYFARRYGEAIAHSRKSLEIGQHPLLYIALGRALVRQGSHAEAIAEYEKAIGIFGRMPTLVSSLGHAHAVAGNQAEAQKIIDELKETSKQRYISSYWIAVVYAGLDDKEQAFAHLEKAIDERFFLLIWLRIEPHFGNLHSDARFAGLLRRMNL